MARNRVMLVPINALEQDRFTVYQQLAAANLHLAKANTAARRLDKFAIPALFERQQQLIEIRLLSRPLRRIRHLNPA